MCEEIAPYQKISSGPLLNIPVIGNLVQKIYPARLCNAMRLLKRQAPLPRALLLSREMIPFYPITSSLAKVEEDIMMGKSLHRSLQQFYFYPQRMIQLIKVGEETNQLDYFFRKVAELFI